MARVPTLGNRLQTANLQRAKPLTTALARLVPGGREERAIKRAIAKRSGGWCECTACRRSGVPLAAAEFDHVIPLWEGGTNDLWNWAHLARPCHKAKTAEEARRRLGLAR